MEIILYLCNTINVLRVKAAAQHSSSELGSAFALHFTCGMKDALTTPLHRGAKGGQQRMFY